MPAAKGSARTPLGPTNVASAGERTFKNFSTLRIEVLELTLMKQYLDMFWSHLTSAMEGYKSIQLAAEHPKEEKS